MRPGRELLVGLVIIVSGLAAVLGTLWLKGTNFGRPHIEVSVLLQGVSQTNEGNAVT